MTLAYDVAGTGQAVVLLHSTACDRRMRDPQWPVLIDAGYRVVRSDFRGYGDTPAPRGPHNDAEDVLDLLGDLGIGPEASEATRERVRAMDLPDFGLIAARLAGLLPAAQAVLLPWAGHLPTLERPEELSAMLTAFLPAAVPAA